MTKQTYIFYFFAGFAIINTLSACQPTSPAVTVPTTPDLSQPLPLLSTADIALGQTLYAANCAGCHGVNLEGQPDWKERNADGSFRAPPHDAEGHTWHHGDLTLLESVSKGGARLQEMNIGGTSLMPAYGEILTEEELTAVFFYIKSTWPDDVRQLQWEATLREQARALE